MSRWSQAVHHHAARHPLGIRLCDSSPQTADGERRVWEESVSWGVNPMPCRVVVVSEMTGEVLAASYYETERGFLSALAVRPAYRGRGLGRLLIAGSLGHMLRTQAAQGRPCQSSLHVLGCDASAKHHGLYTSCGYHGGDEKRGGTYHLSHDFARLLGDGVEQRILHAATS
eukprot:TRINITY_DN3864_c0_g3_i2.p1 TRINITY_DN3864_c0_g3~~TRINITY_DN3864_c0_g3_i2.p1  ORF type:complete len:171 (+),score=1.97 TRINITY_DN3864_c0_g3_i2:81-593(+)